MSFDPSSNGSFVDSAKSDKHHYPTYSQPGGRQHKKTNRRCPDHSSDGLHRAGQDSTYISCSRNFFYNY